MQNSSHPPAASLPPHRYFALAAANSVCMTIIVATIFFWTRTAFHYTDRENLWLGMAIGLAIIPGARYGGRLADRIGSDRLLAAAFAFNAALLLAGWLPAWHYAPFVLVLLYGAVVSTVWPALESAIFRIPSRWSQSRRIAAYNCTWAAANTSGLLLSSLLVGWNPVSVVWVPGVLHGLSLFLLLRRSSVPPTSLAEPPPPAATERAPSSGPTADTKHRFLQTAWMGNAITYVMISVLLPLLPALCGRLGRSPRLVIVMTCLLFLTRVLAFVVFGRWERWHYHRGWNLAALVAAPVAFAGIMLTTSLPVILLSLAVFGMAIGLTYSSSIFYSLDYGGGKAEHSGLHEAMVGIGSLAGPLAGIAGSFWMSDPRGPALAALAVVALGTLAATARLSTARSGIC